MIKVNDEYHIEIDEYHIADLVHTKCRENGSWAVIDSWHLSNSIQLSYDGSCAKCALKINQETFAKAKFIVESMSNG